MSVFLSQLCKKIFGENHSKTPVPESLFFPATLFKKDSSTGAFLWILLNFWEQLFTTFLRTTPPGSYFRIKLRQEQQALPDDKRSLSTKKMQSHCDKVSWNILKVAWKGLLAKLIRKQNMHYWLFIFVKTK